MSTLALFPAGSRPGRGGLPDRFPKPSRSRAPDAQAGSLGVSSHIAEPWTWLLPGLGPTGSISSESVDKSPPVTSAYFRVRRPGKRGSTVPPALAPSLPHACGPPPLSTPPALSSCRKQALAEGTLPAPFLRTPPPACPPPHTAGVRTRFRRVPERRVRALPEAKALPCHIHKAENSGPDISS